MTVRRSIGGMCFARRAGFAACILLLVVGSGCDLPDPSAFLPRASGDASSAQASDAIFPLEEPSRDALVKASPRQTGMESVGPEDSQRIYYQFIDDRGRVQFVERLSEVPAAWRDRVGYVEMSQPPPLTPVEARKSWQLTDGETAKILLASTGPSPVARSGGRQLEDVVLYWAEWCGYCKTAQAHLDREGVDYERRDVDIQANAQELQKKTGRGGIPVLDYSGQILRGYRVEQYDEAIRSIRG